MSDRKVPWETDYWTPQPIWKGQTAFVLASGPSLSDDICERLRGRNVIAVNSTIHAAPWAPVWYFTDSGVYVRHREFARAWPNLIITMSRRAKVELSDPRFLAGKENRCLRVKGASVSGFPSAGTREVRQGRSSGQTAISVAVSLGANVIVLCGFDMRCVNGREHHHDDYRGQQRNLDLYQNEFLPAFKGWHADAEAVGVHIVNATPGSALTEFPFVKLDDLIDAV